MTDYSRRELTDDELDRKLETSARESWVREAQILVHLAEIDARRLYAGHPSMFAYCVEEMDMEEEEACERILVAAIGRRFPRIFEAIAEGQLHCAAVRMIAPHLTEENCEDLVAAATHKCESELHQDLKLEFPSPGTGRH